MHLSKPHLTSTFESLGHSLNDFVSSDSLHRILTTLNGGSPFDKEIFEELWGECRENSLAQVRLGDFVEVILKAKGVILEQNRRVVERIEGFYEEKRRAEGEGRGEETRRKLDQLEDKIRQQKDAKN